MNDRDRAGGWKRLCRIALRWGLIMVGVYVGFCLFIYFYQPRLLYYPTRELEATPEDAGLPYEDVTLRAADGVQLHGWFIPAAGARATVLFCHGNGGNISHRLDSFRVFHNLALNTFIFDYRGYGQSEGKPTEEGTYLDAEAAWKHLTSTRGIAADNVIFFGRSLGGAVAADLATRHAPRALILESTFTSVPDMAAQLYPLLPARALCRYQYDTRQVVRGLHCPLLVVHSVQDDLIPYRHGRAIFEAANEPKCFLPITGGHNNGFLTSGRTYTDGLEAFISEALTPGRRSTE